MAGFDDVAVPASTAVGRRALDEREVPANGSNHNPIEVSGRFAQ